MTVPHDGPVGSLMALKPLKLPHCVPIGILVALQYLCEMVPLISMGSGPISALVLVP